MSFDFHKYIENLEAEAAKNDIGKMLASGIGVGLSQNSYLAITAMENVYVELETLTKNAAKNAEKLDKKRREREVENLKNCFELKLISEQEYYEKLKKYRDENLRQGSDEWYKYTEEIIGYNKRLMEDAAEQQIKAVKKIQALKQQLKEHLTGKDEDWYSSYKVTFLGQNTNGTDLVYHKKTLEDFQEEIRLLERYREAILKLKDMGNIPDGVFSALGKMDVLEAVETAEMLLFGDEEIRRKFLDGYKTRNALADDIATQLNGIVNKEELEEAGISPTDSFYKGFFNAESDGNAQFIKTLEENFKSVPESYYSLGEESGNAFGNGFNGQVSDVVEQAKGYMISAMNDISAELGAIVADFARTVKAGDSNVYNTTYTFNSSRDTTTAQIAAAKNASAMDRVRGIT